MFERLMNFLNSKPRARKHRRTTERGHRKHEGKPGSVERVGPLYNDRGEAYFVERCLVCGWHRIID